MSPTDEYYAEATIQPKDDDQPAEQLLTLRNQVAELTRRVKEFAGETSEAGAATIDSTVRENPYLALGVALFAGIAVGVALRR